jgi:hypothetical protein
MLVSGGVCWGGVHDNIWCVHVGWVHVNIGYKHVGLGGVHGKHVGWGRVHVNIWCRHVEWGTCLLFLGKWRRVEWGSGSFFFTYVDNLVDDQ